MPHFFDQCILLCQTPSIQSLCPNSPIPAKLSTHLQTHPSPLDLHSKPITQTYPSPNSISKQTSSPISKPINQIHPSTKEPTYLFRTQTHLSLPKSISEPAHLRSISCPEPITQNHPSLDKLHLKYENQSPKTTHLQTHPSLNPPPNSTIQAKTHAISISAILIGGGANPVILCRNFYCLTPSSPLLFFSHVEVV